MPPALVPKLRPKPYARSPLGLFSFFVGIGSSLSDWGCCYIISSPGWRIEGVRHAGVVLEKSQMGLEFRGLTV